MGLDRVGDTPRTLGQRGVGAGDLVLATPHFGQPMRDRARCRRRGVCQRCGMQQRQRVRHAVHPCSALGRGQTRQQRQAGSTVLPGGPRDGVVAERLGHQRRVGVALRLLPEPAKARIDVGRALVEEGLAEHHAFGLSRPIDKGAAHRGAMMWRIAQQLDAQTAGRGGGPHRLGQRLDGAQRIEQQRQLRQAGVIRQRPQQQVQGRQVHQRLAEARQRQRAAVLQLVRSRRQARAEHLRHQTLRAAAAVRAVGDLQVVAQRHRARVAVQRGVAAHAVHFERIDAQAAAGKARQVLLQQRAHRRRVGVQVERHRRVHGSPLRRCAPIPPRGIERLGSGPAAFTGLPSGCALRYSLLGRPGGFMRPPASARARLRGCHAARSPRPRSTVPEQPQSDRA